MNPLARLVLVAAALLSGAAGAQTFKCVDAAGKVTYTNGKCSDLGLKNAGEVPDHLNTNPAFRPSSSMPLQPSAPSAPAPAPSAPAAAPPAGGAAPGEGDAPDPSRRCFTVKTPTGNVTRCNERPDQ